ncbi:plasmid stabilization protein [Pasteurellaceae bacterium RH1A]|nr:plasmid stabilization protein [Pasteurellaceae bacterium RH1A]
MPKTVVLSAKARQNIDEILANVVEYTGAVSSGHKLLKAFYTKFNDIGFLPKAYRQLDDGTRQAFCRSYRIVYQEFEKHIEILTVIHSRQQYP